MTALTAIWDTPIKRFVFIFLSCMGLIFVSDQQSMLGAGAVGNIMLGLTTRWLWKRGWPGKAISAEHRADVDAAAARFVADAQATLSFVWYNAAYPLLFGLIGAGLNFSRIDPALAGKATTYAVLACALRVVAATSTALSFRQFTLRERFFCGLAWTAKATTQAAFATVPLESISNWVALNPGASYHGYSAEQLLAWGAAIEWCAVLSVFVGTPLGTLFMVNGAPFLLDRIDSADAAAAPDAADEPLLVVHDGSVSDGGGGGGRHHSSPGRTKKKGASHARKGSGDAFCLEAEEEDATPRGSSGAPPLPPRGKPPLSARSPPSPTRTPRRPPPPPPPEDSGGAWDIAYPSDGGVGAALAAKPYFFDTVTGAMPTRRPNRARTRPRLHC